MFLIASGNMVFVIDLRRIQVRQILEYASQFYSRQGILVKIQDMEDSDISTMDQY